MHPDLAAWDGSDVFLPDGKNAYILVTERVRALLREHRITNVTAVPLDEVEDFAGVRD